MAQAGSPAGGRRGSRAFPCRAACASSDAEGSSEIIVGEHIHIHIHIYIYIYTYLYLSVSLSLCIIDMY